MWINDNWYNPALWRNIHPVPVTDFLDADMTTKDQWLQVGVVEVNDMCQLSQAVLTLFEVDLGKTCQGKNLRDWSGWSDLVSDYLLH